MANVATPIHTLYVLICDGTIDQEGLSLKEARREAAVLKSMGYRVQTRGFEDWPALYRFVDSQS